ncbi:hypothetical protein BH23BAC2_BH23BAC2_09110 [soil metagenome]
MKQENLIALDEICIHHKIEMSFIHSLNESGLIQVTIIREDLFIDRKQLTQLEKYIEFHYSLGINLEGIETINHLLKRMDILQGEVTKLRNMLHFHKYTP